MKPTSHVEEAQRVLLKAVDHLHDAAELVQIAAANLELAKNPRLLSAVFALRAVASKSIALGYACRAADADLQPYAIPAPTQATSPNGGFKLCRRCSHALTPTEEAAGDGVCETCGSFGSLGVQS